MIKRIKQAIKAVVKAVFYFACTCVVVSGSVIVIISFLK